MLRIRNRYQTSYPYKQDSKRSMVLKNAQNVCPQETGPTRLTVKAYVFDYALGGAEGLRPPTMWLFGAEIILCQWANWAYFF